MKAYRSTFYFQDVQELFKFVRYIETEWPLNVGQFVILKEANAVACKWKQSVLDAIVKDFRS